MVTSGLNPETIGKYRQVSKISGMPNRRKHPLSTECYHVFQYTDKNVIFCLTRFGYQKSREIFRNLDWATLRYQFIEFG